MQQPGGQRKMGGTDFKWGSRAPVAPPLATALLFWCHAVMGLHFTHVRSFACRDRLPNVRADCFTVALYYAKVTCKQIF